MYLDDRVLQRNYAVHDRTVVGGTKVAVGGKMKGAEVGGTESKGHRSRNCLKDTLTSGGMDAPSGIV